MNHIVLLGDSIFDNAAYTVVGRDVISYLKDLIPGHWKATLRAVDGSKVSDVRSQVSGLPHDATHLVVSAGGNDAIDQARLLEEKSKSAGHLLNRMADLSDEFEARYTSMLDAVLSLGLPTGLCTVYYPRFSDAFMQRAAVMALGVFNDVIIRNAFRVGLPLIDLRLVCDLDEDFANPLEPSDIGGKKIAAVIWRLVSQHGFEKQTTEVFWR